MKINANDIKVGNILEYQGGLYSVIKTMHTQPGKGGAFMQVEMKEITNGTKMNVRFRTSETVDKAQLESEEFQFLYIQGDNVEFMNLITYEQISFNKSILNEDLPFLQEGMVVSVSSYNGKYLSVTLPENIEVVIKDCESVVKGQTSASSFKPAILENGVRIMIPPFITQGEKVVIKLSTREYLERAK